MGVRISRGGGRGALRRGGMIRVGRSGIMGGGMVVGLWKIGGLVG